DGEIRAALDLVEQGNRDLGRVLEVGVEDAEHLAASDLKAAEHRGREAPLAGAAYHPEPRVHGEEGEGASPGAIGAVVGQEDELIRAGERRGEELGETSDELLDALRLVVRRDDERQKDPGIRRRQRTDLERARRRGDERGFVDEARLRA